MEPIAFRVRETFNLCRRHSRSRDRWIMCNILPADNEIRGIAPSKRFITVIAYNLGFSDTKEGEGGMGCVT